MLVKVLVTMAMSEKSRGFTAYKFPSVEPVLKHKPDSSAAGRIS
ncbi:hypothetical protein [Methylicorpusculum sp.]|nr:hypothetical protein [Methylicorpusculum sp.]MDP3529345.1 hypothetical protein [Methylicorpusculum sp.]MDZ4154396.1 hypothetical protein [Methylicorpusculum sp.]